MAISSQQRKDILILTGEVTESLPNTMFRVTVLEGPEEIIGKSVLCTLNGKMRRFRIRVLPGDKVTAELSVYDLNRGRITRRLRDHELSGVNTPEEQAVQPAEKSETDETKSEPKEVKPEPVKEAKPEPKEATKSEPAKTKSKSAKAKAEEKIEK